MIQVNRGGVTVVRDAAWGAAKRTFADRHLVVLPEFVESSLLQRLVGKVAEGEFCDFEHPSGGREQAMTEPNRVARIFWLLLNHTAVLTAMQEFADVANETFGARGDIVDGKVRSFQAGRCFKLMPERGDYCSWHDDVHDARMMGLTVNLAEGSFGGGLEIGHVHRQVVHRQLAARATPGFGGAVLFRIARGLTHRGLLGEGTEPRCAFSGWFSNCADYRPLNTERIGKQRERPGQGAGV